MNRISKLISDMRKILNELDPYSTFKFKPTEDEDEEETEDYTSKENPMHSKYFLEV